jgi:hypothetical protein
MSAPATASPIAAPHRPHPADVAQARLFARILRLEHADLQAQLVAALTCGPASDSGAAADQLRAGIRQIRLLLAALDGRFAADRPL